MLPGINEAVTRQILAAQDGQMTYSDRQHDTIPFVASYGTQRQLANSKRCIFILVRREVYILK